ncbi:membrane protein FxsA [Mycobacterium kyorinense]|uniref:Membrane protein FxsA n=1 Tax=Mycobacterium kyorinense TaxID=487514 RepID=A0A1A2YQ71_9MYCO|nr:FxsA family protein [Mycobacterium kyorinense]OBI40384.1 membrane protein FxsA [Mycobacterium kyorinense]
MVSRLFFVYVVVELAVVVALASTIGLGWTLLVLLGTFVIGTALAGRQLKRQLTRARTAPGGAVTDSALIALGTMLVVVPGLVTTAAGVLLLLPPTRAAARPLLTAMAARRIGQPLITVTTLGGDRVTRSPRDDVIDGEVIDVTDVQPPAFPSRHD